MFINVINTSLFSVVFCDDDDWVTDFFNLSIYFIFRGHGTIDDSLNSLIATHNDWLQSHCNGFDCNQCKVVQSKNKCPRFNKHAHFLGSNSKYASPSLPESTPIPPHHFLRLHRHQYRKGWNSLRGPVTFSLQFFERKLNISAPSITERLNSFK